MNKKDFNKFIDNKIITYIEVPNTGEYGKWVTVHFRALKVNKEGRAAIKIQAGMEVSMNAI